MIGRVHDALREKTRRAAGKKPTPTAAIIDSRSVRTGEGGEQRGYDAGKKITGRKLHLAVDTLGLVLVAVVHSAKGGPSSRRALGQRNSSRKPTNVIELIARLVTIAATTP